MFKKTFTLIISTLTLISSNSLAREYRSSLVLDMDSGTVLQSYKPEEKIYPASLTKLMTLYITFEALDQGLLSLNQKLIVSKTASAQPASKIGVTAGEKISVEKCIKSLAIKSANDSAMVLSENISGEEGDFAEIMTRVAQEIGMKDTVFKNSSGLNNNNQVTTAKDMALLAMAIKRHFPHYYHYFNQRQFEYKGRIIRTHNNILKKYKGADGLKTGYTAASGYNLIASAKNDSGQRILGVVIGFNNPHKRDDEMVYMLDYGFEKLNNKTNINYLGWKLQKQKSKNSELKQPYKITKPKVKTIPKPSKATTNNNIQFNNSAIKNSKLVNYVSKPTYSTPVNYTYKIQIGAFSEQSRAENYVRHTSAYIPSNYQYKKMIGKTHKAGKNLYRSLLYVPNESEGLNICNILKSNGKSCFVRKI